MKLLLLFVIATSGPNVRKSPETDLVAKLQRFISTARSGAILNSFSGDLPPLTDRKTLLQGKLTQFTMGKVSARLDSTTGAIYSFSDFYEMHRRVDRSPNQLSKEELTALAKRYYRDAGFSEDLFLYHVDESDDGGVQVFDLHLLPRINGIPVSYDDHVSMSVEHVSGRLIGFSRRVELPRPPVSLTPGFGVPEGRARVVQKMFAFRPQMRGLYERQPLRLVIWRPTAASERSFTALSPADVLSGESGQGRLVYWGYFHDLSTRGLPGGPRAYDVFMDAKSGQMLKIDVIEEGSGGGSGPKIKLNLDFPKGPISVYRNGKWIHLTASIAPSQKQFPPKKLGSPRLLMVGRAYIRVQLDADQGLIYFDNGNGFSIGKPSENLRRELVKSIDKSIP